MFYAPVRLPFPPHDEVRPQNPRPFNQRNEALGGYLEGRINTRFPITRWADFDPYGIISVSFRDRTEPGGANPYGGHPLTGWNHVQVGAELPIHLAHLGGFSSTKWGASRRRSIFRAVRSVLLSHFKSTAGHGPRRMVGRRKIRGYLLVTIKSPVPPRSLASFGVSLQPNQRSPRFIPLVRLATTVCCAPAGSSWFSSLT